MMTYCIIADNGIKLPLSISANTNTGIESIDEQVLSDNFKNQVEKMLNYPLIIKKSHSKGGKGIYKINNRKDLDNICNELKG
ncbi:MAG: hypothetical protein LBF15_04700 [Candidatus Peribacteria bacterium]|jgi:glutathione synthase/RimK-type ligase-like ATP-grasp enzyme|nr:hypothetical protein [Candidatus Peribacteria bacterium]